MIRQKGAINFVSYYESLCALENVCPIQQIRTSSKDGKLECTCDRLRRADWHPLTTALKVNKSLKEVKLKVKWKHLYACGKMDFKAPKLKSSPIHEKDVRYDLMKAIKSCLLVTTSLSVLRLEGIVVTKADLSCLSKGLMKNTTLSTISFCGSSIGDDGVHIVCQSLKNSLNIEWLDFTSCNISHHGACVIADLIKQHGLLRYCDAWKDSLRQCEPNFSSMSGLRRVTLNLNKNIGDTGLRSLADSLRDDLWINAMDLQTCGITSDGARYVIGALKWNKAVSVCDLRANELIDDDVLDELCDVLQNTCRSGGATMNRYESLPVEVEEIKNSMKTFAPCSTHRPSAKQSSRLPNTLHVNSNSYIKKAKGFPWRTAARKVQRWKLVTSRSRNHRQYKPHSNTPTSSNTPCSYPKDVKIGMEAYKSLHAEQSLAMAQLESKIADLEEENRLLKMELTDLKSKLGYYEQRGVDDASTLDEIESSIQQFHSFLDLLRSKGLEDVCTLVQKGDIEQVNRS